MKEPIRPNKVTYKKISVNQSGKTRLHITTVKLNKKVVANIIRREAVNKLKKSGEKSNNIFKVIEFLKNSEKILTKEKS